ncbi:hypothetical protein ABK040_008606 [Willaertia magna]
MKRLIFCLLSILLIINYSLQIDENSIHMQDIEVLTLKRDSYTTGRRSASIPQLNCLYTPDGYQVDVVQCKNTGWDGIQFNWKCEAEMDKKYRFSHINVNCEGYRYSGDQVVLKGSCALEYRLEYTNKGENARQNNKRNSDTRRQQRQTYQHKAVNTETERGVGSFGFVLFMLAVIAFCWLCCRPRLNIPTTQQNTTPYPTNPNVYPNAFPTYQDGAFSNASAPECNNIGTTGRSGITSRDIGSFGAGVATGFVASKLFEGNNTSRHTNSGSYFTEDYNNYSHSSYNDDNDRHSNYRNDDDDDSTYKATGYGGSTSR